jgi:hypothetical protein
MRDQTMWVYMRNDRQFQVGFICNNQFVVVETFLDQRSAELKVSFLNGGMTADMIPSGVERKP